MNSAKSQLFQPYLEGGKPHTKQSQAVKQPVLLFPQTQELSALQGLALRLRCAGINSSITEAAGGI